MDLMPRGFALSICSLSASFLFFGCQVGSDPLPQIETGTLEAVASQIAESTLEAPDTPEVSARVVTPLPTTSETPTSIPLLAYRPTPGEPPPQLSFLTDRSSAPLASQERTIGDYFIGNLFERPLTTDKMDYHPYIDIAPGAELSFNPPWLYITIHLEEIPPAQTTVTYGVEFDMDFDGRGDYLLLVTSPNSTEWSKDRVEVFTDTNDDVGGEIPMMHDDNPGDGYETLIFGENVGADRDTAWARIAVLEDSQSVQLALKQALLGSWRNFAWNVWADEGVNDPTMMDYNDHYTPEEAGSPVITDINYPLGELELIDNTCRSVISYIPYGSVPGLCPLAKPTATLGPTPTSGTPATP